MRKRLVSIIAFLVLFPFFAFSGSESYNGVGFARISYVKGDVYIQRAQNQGYEQGEINLALTAGDKLGSREGQAEIQLGNRNYLRIDGSTQLDIVALPSDSSGVLNVHLLAGSIYLRVNEAGSEKSIEVHTPDASFYILDQGLYRLDVRENKETELRVFEGSAEAAGEQGSQQVNDREQLIASNGAIVLGPAAFAAGTDDDFGRFNASRDALFAKRSPRSYLPSDIDEYQEELDNNGRWTYEEPYGNVWVPNVYDEDWHPYYYGRWDWYPSWGWTWISSEPWGWCTYHYGRWHWRFGLGWYWIPTSIWGPAWVDWCWGYNYVGWCPLSYYNYPVVVINNRFYDRFHDRDYPLHSRALTVVHRDHLQSPYINRHALAGDRVNALGRISLSHEQPNVRPLVGREGLNRTLAERTLDRSSLRGVGRSFGEAKSLTPGQLRSSGVRSNNLSQRGVSSGSLRDVRDRSSIREFRGTVRSQDSVSRSTLDSRGLRTGPTIKNYPSRRSFSSFFSSRFSGSASRTGSSSSRNIRSYSRDSSISSRSRSSYRSGTSGTARVREYRSSSSVSSRNRSSSFPKKRSSGGYFNQSPGYSGNRYQSPSRYSLRYSSPFRSYSSPYRSGSSYWGNPSRSYAPRFYSSRSYSSPRSYYSQRSYGSSSYGRFYGSSSSRSFSALSSGSRSSSISRSSRSSSSGHSSSSSHSHSGSIRRR